jgi:hypothetical protein
VEEGGMGGLWGLGFEANHELQTQNREEKACDMPLEWVHQRLGPSEAVLITGCRSKGTRQTGEGSQSIVLKKCMRGRSRERDSGYAGSCAHM